MKTFKQKNISKYGFIAIVFFVCLSIFSAFFVETSWTASAASTSVNVHVGDEIEAADYELSYGSGKVQAEGLTVVYPDGGVYGGKSFVIEQPGEYEVTYYANVNNERIEEKCTYLAVRTPKELIVADEGTTVAYGKYEVDSPYQIQQAMYGALVGFKSGQSITFTAKIKTEKLTKDYNIIDLIVMPSVFSETDFEKLTIRVADAENPDNYVEVIVASSNMLDGNGQVSYVRAGAAGQQIGGYEGTTYHTVSYGAQIEHSFRGLGHTGDFREDVTVSEHSLTLSIDNESKKVYCGPVSNSSKDKVIVNDLDDAAHYKGNPWGGFTSDEVTVKVTAGAFAKSTGTVLFKSFGDYSFGKDVADKLAPEIKIEYDENDVMPVAVVGTEFKMIPYTAKDNLDTALRENVYVYYVGGNGEKINVSHNGESFFVKYEGRYQIVYSVEDYSGNKSEKSVEITATKKLPEIFIAIDTDTITAEVYETIYVCEAENMAVFGGSGVLTVERAVYDPDKQLLDVEDTLLLTKL